ncbi:MAG TPA: hypothetical protein DCR97_03415 [Deltaproteobacteria bacterium]|nr:hypothetical protein [Deltaproteobacteria bacterium]
MFAFLKNLPTGYTLYSELKLNVDVESLREKKPDFVIVSEDVGVVSVEVKDWNLNRFIYEWRDQYKIRKIDRQTGQVVDDDIDNPGAQVAAYRYGLMGLLGKDNFAKELWVSSLLAFPLLTRQEFLNSVQKINILTGDPQAKFYVNLKSMLFKDDLDRHVEHPERLLIDLVKREGRFRPASGKAVFKANEVLMPSKFRVGGDALLQEARKQIEVLSEQQMKWAFSLDKEANYLLDVAGSGKTNALISKAIHFVDTAIGKSPDILLTTYNRNLEQSLCRIFRDKVGDEANSKYQGIKIISVPALLEIVVDKGYGEGTALRISGDFTNEDDAERRLLSEAKEVIREDPTRFQRFDHVFIDEIQDFSDDFLRIVKRFSRGESFFFVGDIGQKIYPRHYDLQRLGLALHRKGLDPSYRMYRTPRYIAELATGFVLGDAVMRKEFAEHGYTSTFIYPNPLHHAAVIRQEYEPEKACAALVSELLQTTYPCGENKILLVTSSLRLATCKRELDAAGVRCRIGEKAIGDAVTIVEFRDSKGLEREVVVVLGIEDLYARGIAAGVFDEASEQLEREALDRRKIYVALTRAMEGLYIIHQDRMHPFVKELCDLNERIAMKRTKG